MAVPVTEERPQLMSLDFLERNFSDVSLNITKYFNLNKSFDLELIERFERNLRVTQPWLSILIVGYCVLIVFGATGNCLLVAAVMRKPRMRTVRNVFVINLAVSDLLLCLVTMPLTLMEVVTIHWPLGTHAIGCKIAGTLQGTSIFVSTLSITAIALDRHQVIVNPTEKSLKRCGAVFTLVGIWVSAFVISLPNFIWRTLETHEINLSSITYISFCFEDWPSDYGRAAYSALVMLLQYCLPILTIVFAHARICNRLRDRMISSTPTPSIDQRKAKSSRMKKTKKLLINIVVIFCLSWLPLNLYNTVVDISNPFSDTELMFIVYAICHMIGMSSACSNPLLYGWLNTNFRKEFFEIFASLLPCCCSELTVATNQLGETRNSSRVTRADNPSLLELYPTSLKKDGRRSKRKEERLKERRKRDQESSSSFDYRDESSSVDLQEKRKKDNVIIEVNGKITTTIF